MVVPYPRPNPKTFLSLTAGAGAIGKDPGRYVACGKTGQNRPRGCSRMRRAAPPGHGVQPRPAQALRNGFGLEELAELRIAVVFVNRCDGHHKRDRVSQKLPRLI